MIPGRAALLNYIVIPPLERRRDEWMRDVADAVRRLQDAGRVRIDDLQHDEKFIDAVLTASTAAIRVHDREKRDALRNAVLNSALPGGPEAVQQQIFLAHIDRYTGLHLTLLDMFNNPSGWQPKDRRPVSKQNARAFVWSVFPNLREELAQGVWADLYHDGFVTTPVIDNGMEGSTVAPRTTPYGRSFLDFVKEP